VSAIGRSRFRMPRLRTALILPLLLFTQGAGAQEHGQEHGRIKKKPPTVAEAERIISETAMNDGTLQRGDIVVTDRGFFLYRGTAADGFSNDFVAVPNPLSSKSERGTKF
jgi:hypothetical protein